MATNDPWSLLPSKLIVVLAESIVDFLTFVLHQKSLRRLKKKKKNALEVEGKTMFYANLVKKKKITNPK